MKIRYVYGCLMVMASVLNGADPKLDGENSSESIGVAAIEYSGVSGKGETVLRPLPRSKSAGDINTLFVGLISSSRAIQTTTDSGSQPPRTIIPPTLDSSLIVIPESVYIQPPLQIALSQNIVASSASFHSIPLDNCDESDVDNDSETDDPQIFNKLSRVFKRQKDAYDATEKGLVKLYDMTRRYKGDLRQFYTPESSNESSAIPSGTNSVAASVYTPLPRSSDVQASRGVLVLPTLQPLIAEMDSMITAHTKYDAATQSAISSAQNLAARTQTFLNAAQQDLNTASTAINGGDISLTSSHNQRPVVLNGSDESKDRAELSSSASIVRNQPHQNNTANKASKAQLLLAVAAGSAATLVYQNRGKITQAVVSNCVVQ